MRPRPNPVSFVVDGVEVTAPEGEMLVDAAKRGDVEIPVFCYEPKLGNPVGACRMCLVEIEGLPKLQTACSTPVRDGMVVYTQSDKARDGQSAVVEFLLANHPLDCPVCDKGGECPLQDISMGWGGGRSRFTEPKRHFQKPLPLSPLIAIDRERCILCYRCVRFSQDVTEDEQLQLLERGADTYVGTFSDRPYVAPFHGNITELCPVGALTSRTYRFRARPWDIEDAGTVCTLCPSQCNVKLTVRDERAMRVQARDNPGVDDGWLCDKGRYAFQAIEAEERITRPLVGGEPAGWAEALEAVARGLEPARGRAAAILGGGTTNEEGWLVQRILRGALESTSIDCRRAGGASRDGLRALGSPATQATVSDIDHAGAVLVLGTEPLNDAPILDLRLRKAVRLNGARLCVATSRPTSLDGGAVETVRFAPGEDAGFAVALAAALGAEGFEEPGSHGGGAARIASALSEADDAVVLYSERILAGERGEDAARALVEIARSLGLDSKPECGLLEIPEEANGRGLREVGCLPDAGPGLAEAPAGLDAPGIREALAAGDLDALILSDADVVRDGHDGPGWTEALRSARFVVAIAAYPSETTRAANVVLPAESYAEKDGTVTHFDGRLQRVRPGVPHPEGVRRTWQALLELAAALGDEVGAQTAREVWVRASEAVSFYAGLEPEDIAGVGLRWPERDGLAGAWPPPAGDRPASTPPAAGRADGVGDLIVGATGDLWASPAVEHSPALEFLTVSQRLEISPDDADRLGLAEGDEADVSAGEGSIVARVAIRERIPAGTGFVVSGTADQAANVLGPLPAGVTIRRRVAATAGEAT